MKYFFIGLAAYAGLCYIAARLIVGPRKTWGLEEGIYFIGAPFLIPWSIKEWIKEVMKL